MPIQEEKTKKEVALSYTGESIQDYFDLTKRPSSFENRKPLYESWFKEIYTGSATQNQKFLEAIKQYDIYGILPTTATTPAVQTPVVQPTINLTATETEFQRLEKLIALWNQTANNPQFESQPESEKIKLQNTFLNKANDLIKEYFTKTQAFYQSAETDALALSLSLQNQGLDNSFVYIKLANLKTALNEVQTLITKHNNLAALGAAPVVLVIIGMILTAAAVGAGYYLGSKGVTDELNAYKEALTEANQKLLELNQALEKTKGSLFLNLPNIKESQRVFKAEDLFR